MTTGVGDRVERVRTVKLKNFRGWVGDNTWTTPVSLDADVVVITAANGRGKSSLIEAIAWVLNGGLLHAEGSNQSLGQNDGPEVELEVALGTIADPTVECLSSRGGRARRNVDGPDAQLLTRATTFLQDRLDDQFEQDASQSSLLKFLAPEPAWLASYVAAVAKALRDVERDLRDASVGPSVAALESARRRRDLAATDLKDSLVELRPEVSPATQPARPAIDELRDVIIAFVGRGGGSDIADLLNRLKADLDQGTHSTASGRREIADAQERLEVAQDSLKTHREAWPNLEAIAAWSGSRAGPQAAPDLQEVLSLVSGLAGGIRTWADTSELLAMLSVLPPSSKKERPQLETFLTKLAAEFADVDSARAADYRDQLDIWTTFWQTRRQERREREEALEEARRELERKEKDGASQALDRVNILRRRLAAFETEEKLHAPDQGREATLRRNRDLAAVLRAQRQLFADMRVKTLAPKVRSGIEQAMNAVMRHFVVAGLESATKVISVEERGDMLEPELADGRTRAGHMSTGQTAQMALAWLLGSNALLHKVLPHGILLLDDISTALDLTNIAAECALLRKFAYTRNEGRRRQVIIASHHDQLTHRMLDLMLPPQGYSLLEVTLVDWNPRTGPIRRESTIRSTGGADTAARERLGKRLDNVLYDRTADRRAV